MLAGNWIDFHFANPPLTLPLILLFNLATFPRVWQKLFFISQVSKWKHLIKTWLQLILNTYTAEMRRVVVNRSTFPTTKRFSEDKVRRKSRGPLPYLYNPNQGSVWYRVWQIFGYSNIFEYFPVRIFIRIIFLMQIYSDIHSYFFFDTNIFGYSFV